MAQRGGIVVSQLRLGDSVYSPLIPSHGADLAISLERHEALRALNLMCSKGSTLVYYDTVWQPLAVRLGEAPEATTEDVADQCSRMDVRLVRVYKPDLADVRMQNIAVLSCISSKALIPGIQADHCRAAMADLMAGGMLEKNMALFEKELAEV